MRTGDEVRCRGKIAHDEIGHLRVSGVTPGFAGFDQDRSQPRPSRRQDVGCRIANKPGPAEIYVEVSPRILDKPRTRLATLAWDLERPHLAREAPIRVVRAHIDGIDKRALTAEKAL